jgi:hypothetical protein
VCRHHSQTTIGSQGAEALVPMAGDQAWSTSLLASDVLCPAWSTWPVSLSFLGYLTCSGIFMKVPSETQNRGKQVCHRVLLEDTWLTQQWVYLPTDTRS